MNGDFPSEGEDQTYWSQTPVIFHQKGRIKHTGQTPVRADVRFVGGGGDRLGSSRDFDDGHLPEESEMFETFSLLEHS